MPKAEKGSKKWIQVLVNNYPNILNECIGEPQIKWVSPLKEDDYKEYRDNVVLGKLGMRLDNYTLQDFWPYGGQTWDALGKTDQETFYLVEAKSHITEIDVGGTGAVSKSSIDLISKSLEEVKEYLNVNRDVDWSKYFYQYCNRLAYLYLLRVLNSVDAYLVWVFFINDEAMNGPSKVEEWFGAIKLMKKFLGVGGNKLDPYVKYCFIDLHALS